MADSNVMDFDGGLMPAPPENSGVMISAAGFDWRAFDAYLFDIDGTLVNSRGAVHYHSFHTALREVWHCERKIDEVSVHGNTDIGILRATAGRAGVSPEDFARRLPRALAIMQAEVERNQASWRVDLCPSVVELLDDLRSAGKLLAVTSGNLERIGWIELHRAGLDRYFAFGSFCGGAWAEPEMALCRETRLQIFRHGAEEVRRRLGDQASLCFVGDTPHDIVAAHALEVPVIAVATGIYNLVTLRGEKPDLCLPSYDALFSNRQR